jgi:hypothetical protein
LEKPDAPEPLTSNSISVDEFDNVKSSKGAVCRRHQPPRARRQPERLQAGFY